MENKDLILVDGEKEVYLEKRRRHRGSFKRTAFRLFCLILIAGALTCAIFLLPKVKELLDSGKLDGIFPPNSGTDVGENPNGSQGGSNNGNGTQGGNGAQVGEGGGQADTDNALKAPTGAYKIEAATQEYKVTNETKIEVEPSAPTLISPIEIKNKYGGEAPLVLITHRAPKECYSNGEYYTADSNFYAQSENIASLANALSTKLNALGIKTLYLDEEYAKGSVLGTLEEYEKSVNETLSSYPSISYVFCISRGIYINDDMSVMRESIEINGEKCAQVRIISGTSGEKLTEAQKKNVSFALDFASFSAEKAGTFVCENKIARFPLGQSISPFALEIELGTYANTYDEAQNSTEVLSRLIFEYLMAVGGA